MAYSLLRTDDATLPTLKSEGEIVIREGTARKVCTGSLLLSMFAILCACAFRTQLQEVASGTLHFPGSVSMDQADNQWKPAVDTRSNHYVEDVHDEGKDAFKDARRTVDVTALEVNANEQGKDVGGGAQVKELDADADQSKRLLERDFTDGLHALITTESLYDGLKRFGVYSPVGAIAFGFVVGPVMGLVIVFIAHFFIYLTEFVQRWAVPANRQRVDPK